MQAINRTGAHTKPDQLEPLLDWKVLCVAAILFVFSSAWVTALVGASEEVVQQTAAVQALSDRTRTVFYIPYVLIILLVAFNARKVFTRLATTPTLLFLALLPFVSMFWSIDPAITLRRAFALFMTVIAGVAIAETLGWRRAIFAYALVFAAVVLLCYGYAILWPTHGKMWKDFPGVWRGVWSHKNTLGLEMTGGVVVLLAASVVMPAQKWIWRGFAALAFGLLLLSTSKTALLAGMLGIATMTVVGMTRRGPLMTIVAAWLTGTALLLIGGVAIGAPEMFFKLLGKDATLTGRTKIWAAVQHQLPQHPVTGFGFGAVWSNTDVWTPLAKITKEQGFLVGEAHNAWLEAALDLGYLGDLALALLFGMILFKIGRRFFDKSVYLALPFMVMFLLTSLTEANAMVQNDWTWTLVIMIATKYAQRPERTAVAARLAQAVPVAPTSVTPAAWIAPAPAPSPFGPDAGLDAPPVFGRMTAARRMTRPDWRPQTSL